MHHGLENDCFLSIAEGDLWKCSGKSIVGEMEDTKEYPREHPCSADDPCPSSQKITEKSLSPGTIIVLSKNHSNEPQSESSSDSEEYGDWDEREKNSDSCPRRNHPSEPDIGNEGDKKYEIKKHREGI